MEAGSDSGAGERTAPPRGSGISSRPSAVRSLGPLPPDAPKPGSGAGAAGALLASSSASTSAQSAHPAHSSDPDPDPEGRSVGDTSRSGTISTDAGACHDPVPSPPATIRAARPHGVSSTVGSRGAGCSRGGSAGRG
ncbi:hypothetical protein, partial [Pseudonocardia xinjiangensis]